jgi:hypothetical protein
VSDRKFPKALRPLIDAAIELGWTVDWTKNSHIRFRPPKDSPWPLYFASATPSDHRSYRNCTAFLKGCGVEPQNDRRRRS